MDAEAFADHGDWISYRWARSIVLVGGLPRVRVCVCICQLPDPACHFQVPLPICMCAAVSRMGGEDVVQWISACWRARVATEKSCRNCVSCAMACHIALESDFLQVGCMPTHTRTHRQSAHTMTHYAHDRPCSLRWGLRLEKCCEAGLLGWDIARMVTWNGWLDVEPMRKVIGCCQNVLGPSFPYSTWTWMSTYILRPA